MILWLRNLNRHSLVFKQHLRQEQGAIWLTTNVYIRKGSGLEIGLGIACRW